MKPLRRGLPAGVEIAAVSITAACNLAVNRLFMDLGRIPANLGTAGLLTWFAHKEGATWADMGMDPAKLKQGVRWGLRAAVPIVLVIGAGVALPWTRKFFADEQVTSASGGEVLWHLFVEIPIGTALAEELLFRGALLGIFERRHSRRTADAMSAVLFGLWHVLPTIDQLQTNPAGDGISGTWGKVGAVGGVVVLTTIAGYGFALLRDKSDSVAAPVIAHTALNAAAYVGGRVAAGLLGVRI